MTNLHVPRRGDSRIARTGFGLHKANGVTLTVGACIARPPKQDWIMHTTNENAQIVGADVFIRPRVAESATPTNCELNLFCANFADGRGYGFAITLLPLRDIFPKKGNLRPSLRAHQIHFVPWEILRYAQNDKFALTM